VNTNQYSHIPAAARGLAAVLCLAPAPAPSAAGLSALPGLRYEYFGGTDLTRLGDAGEVNDLSAMDKGHQDWAVRFTRLLTAPADGEYAFRAEADCGIRLKLADKLIINGWSRNGERNGKATLLRGQAVALVVEYYFDRGQGGKTATLRLFWTPPGGQEAPIPASAYSHRPPPPPAPSVINVHGNEQGRVNLQLPDGGLKPLVGVHNVQVFRASRGKPELADGDGWTYAHHQDMAIWKGRLYVAWAMTPKDEDVPPYKVVYATSADGLRWSAPADLFPRELAWACRFYFYRAANGRMLAFSAGKSAEGNVSEAEKKVLLVREVAADHSLGKVFTLVHPLPSQPPTFETANDPGFVAACREAAGHALLLEQQDYGRFLGDRRMRWHGDPSLNIPGWCQFGKAFCFYHRKDGVLVGLCKMGFATLSEDAGKTWSRPVQPPTLIAGSAKVWGQRTADGRFALVYNPDRGKRYPLVLVQGDDGREFRDMRVVHGELPRQRYQGKYKDLGAQYIRGLAEWADDGTFADRQAIWLVYSVNKEDIWVARVPLPLKPDKSASQSDDFARVAPGAVVPGWNLYSPRWAPVAVVADGDKRCLELRDADPFDYARAVRVFPESARPRVEVLVKPSRTDARLEIELCDDAGRRPVRIALSETGQVQAADGGQMREVGRYAGGSWMTFSLAADLTAGRYTLQVDKGESQNLAVAEPGCKTVQRLSLRTGPWRGLGDGGPVEPAADTPVATPAVFLLSRVSVQAPSSPIP